MSVVQVPLEQWQADQMLMRALLTPPEPADAEVLVVVPTVRPQNAESFMRSLRASTGLATVLAVVSDEATQQAWDDAGAETHRTTAVPWAGKANAALESGWPALRDWIFLVGDDVRFHPGWWDRAYATAKRTGANVIGINDLGNAKFHTGVWSTHQVISTRYIAEQGASWDGPGTLAHEGYRFWYADDELCTVAVQRGTFATAPDAIVEHLHPAFGRGTDDEWYRQHGTHAEADRAIYAERYRRFFLGEEVAS